MRTVRELLGEAASSERVLNQYGALTNRISGDVATEVASQWGGGALPKVHLDGKHALAGGFTVARRSSREEIVVDWEIDAAQYEVTMQVHFRGPGAGWQAAADMEGRNATSQGMATHILAVLEARGVAIGDAEE